MESEQTIRTNRNRIIAITGDPELQQLIRTVFDDGVELSEFSTLSEVDNPVALKGADAILIDLGASPEPELMSLLRVMAQLGGTPPVLVVTQAFDENLARMCLQIGVAEFLTKPLAPAELKKACSRAMDTSAGREVPPKTQVYTFMPAVGGAGVTTLAVQTAMLLHKQKRSDVPCSTCLVDLDFQHGTIAEYLDIEPRLNISEIESRPERLDFQLLEIMISRHQSGLAVLAAPNQPFEMRSPRIDTVTQLLDLIAANFDNVVIDMPRNWQTWTEVVLRGSDKLFIVSRMRVPVLRRAKQLTKAIEERLAEDGPKPQVLVNCFERRIFRAGLRRSDICQVLGEALAGTIPPDYALVHEAIDRGVALDDIKSNNGITLALKKLLLPQRNMVQTIGKFGSLRAACS